jgi:hypothetical protein
MHPIPELEWWLAFFRARRDRSVDLPWASDTRLGALERERIARSIATFQLGESSEGGHLIAAARSFGLRRGVPELEEVTELFIREEQFHAALLAAFMKANDIPAKRTEWSDRVFRALRRHASFELAVSVLIVAELIALTYYRALAAATSSAVLREICETILLDEACHVAYESTLLRRLRERHGRVTRRLVRGGHVLLYAGAVAVVFAGHRQVLRPGGYGLRRFWTECWISFAAFYGG